VYWQLGVETPELAARIDLLCHLMYEPLFNRLRTNETLGYSVDCSARCTHGVMGFVIAVTSATHKPTHIEGRAMAFLGRFLPVLGRMPRATYASNVEAAAANKLRDDHNLADEVQRALSEIESRQYAWDRAEREADAMRTVSQPDLCAWARRMLLGDGKRMLSIHSHEGSIAQPEEQPLPNGATAVAAPAAFKKPLQVHRRVDKPLPALATIAHA
jgi:insulysin